MDQIKIGKFIASERKSKNLTQKQLAEQLNISDKTVSKWECGKGLPEVTFMLPLCEILQITVNELLSGERVYEQDYQKKAEENMMNLVREQEESRKKIILSAIVAFTGAILGVLLIYCAAEMIEMSMLMRIFIIVTASLGFILCVGVAIVLDREAGAFECPECRNRFVPSMKEYIMGPHTITKRKLKCPHCGEVSYCRHVLSR
ncbi:MAG: helix-turn-helix domain-containing protein [Lachnospiraceae bacterium]|nr:helix-turn-helix domain-containing protein [Lachnospiraceae bacterium]